MKVYVVLEKDSYTDFIYCGVYGTNEKAEERIDEIVKEFNKDKDNFYVEETEV